MKNILSEFTLPISLVVASQLLGAGQRQPDISLKEMLRHTHPGHTIILPETCVDVAQAIQDNGGKCTENGGSDDCQLPADTLLRLPPETQFSFQHEHGAVSFAGTTGDKPVSMLIKSPITGTFRCENDDNQSEIIANLQ